MRWIITCGLLALGVCASGQSFEVVDFTSEGLFTSDIEGPMFDVYGNLYVVNFKKNGTIGRVRADGTAELFVDLPRGSTANAIQFRSDGTMLLADWTGHMILRVNMKTKRIQVHASSPFNQPNDLTINKKNQVFASDPDWKNGTGKLWRIEPDGRVVLLASDMGTTNGITLSSDEKTLYVNESVQRKVWAFDLDSQGNLSRQRLVASFDDFGLDGMKCDAAGNLWITRHGKGTVVVLDEAGKQRYEIQLKGKKPSNLVFSPDGRYAYVTMQDRGCVERITRK